MPQVATLSREYEAQAAAAKTVAELREIASRHVARTREELVGKLDRARAEANRRKAEAEKAQAEAERLKESLRRLSSELDARSARIARADLEDLKRVLQSALQPCRRVEGVAVTVGAAVGGQAVGIDSGTKPKVVAAAAAETPRTLESPSMQASPSSPCELRSNQTEAVLRLRHRLEQLEKAHAKLKKEHEQLRAERSHAALSSGEPAILSSPSRLSASAADMRLLQGDSPEAYSQQARCSPRTPAASSRQSPTLGSPHAGGRILRRSTGSLGLTSRAASPGSPSRQAAGGGGQWAGSTSARQLPGTTSGSFTAAAVSSPGEERLLNVVRRLEKEQQEQQQYADQVVTELGNALRALEAENGTLQGEVRQGGRKASVEAEHRRRLEKQVKLLEKENAALQDMVISYHGAAAVGTAGDISYRGTASESSLAPLARSNSGHSASAVVVTSLMQATNGQFAASDDVMHYQLLTGVSNGVGAGLSIESTPRSPERSPAPSPAAADASPSPSWATALYRSPMAGGTGASVADADEHLPDD
eukprot:TRINITY_DN21529_c0_g1_i1.p1 TRINITY_DN21529_c0_g1~~TRINITY_DN21529_c0_g1_i1.p1  ORF type:complete len:535 (-),score=137.56 TRINITY_DN21529_c0_g1_i1:68-1672(-)